MGHEMLSKVRKLNRVLNQDLIDAFPFTNLCTVLSDLIDANVYIISDQGKALGGYFNIMSDRLIGSQSEMGSEKYLIENNWELPNCTDTKANLWTKEIQEAYIYDLRKENKFHTIIPIKAGKEKFGTLIMIRYSPDFSCNDLVLGEFAATILGLEIQRSVKHKDEEETRKDEIVKIAMNTLSYSENEAINKIFEELDGMEGILVASKIADHSSITRSIIVTALRKLECAGIIASKSLGMKGTHIRVLNKNILGLLVNPIQKSRH